MLEYSLNIIGSEWIIIIFIALILLLGTNRFPEIATKLGKTVGEYNKAKNKIQNEMKDFSKENLEILLSFIIIFLLCMYEVIPVEFFKKVIECTLVLLHLI